MKWLKLINMHSEIQVGKKAHNSMKFYIYVNFHFAETITATINYYRCAFQYKEVGQSFDMKIKVPVASIFGTADKYLSVAAAEGSKDFIEDFKQTFIDGASHWVHMEKPDQVNQIMEKYLI